MAQKKVNYPLVGVIMVVSKVIAQVNLRNCCGV